MRIQMNTPTYVRQRYDLGNRATIRMVLEWPNLEKTMVPLRIGRKRREPLDKDKVLRHLDAIVEENIKGCFGKGEHNTNASNTIAYENGDRRQKQQQWSAD